MKFTRPVPGHKVWILMDPDRGRALAKIKRAHGSYVARVYTGQNLGGTHGDPCVKVFATLAEAKSAILTVLNPEGGHLRCTPPVTP